MGSRGLVDFQKEFIKYLQNKSFDEIDIDMIVNKRGDLGIKWHDRMWKKFCHTEKVRLTRKEKYLFLTLSPCKKLRNLEVTQENCEALDEWCNRWLNNNPYHYGSDPEYKYVLEGGSQNSHLHAHIVVKLLNSHKHAEKLKRSWAKTFPNNQLLTTLNKNRPGWEKKRGEYCTYNFDCPKMLKLKLDYCIPGRKGEDHENLVDLGFGGQRGFINHIGVNPPDINPVDELLEVNAESEDSASDIIENIDITI